jgi:hypothetical protein
VSPRQSKHQRWCQILPRSETAKARRILFSNSPSLFSLQAPTPMPASHRGFAGRSPTGRYLGSGRRVHREIGQHCETMRPTHTPYRCIVIQTHTFSFTPSPTSCLCLRFRGEGVSAWAPRPLSRQIWHLAARVGLHPGQRGHLRHDLSTKAPAGGHRPFAAGRAGA